MKLSSYKKIVRTSAIYDVLMTFGYAFPILAVLNINFVSSLHEGLSLSGTIPGFEPLHLFFVNLMGGIVLVWSALRIYKPEPLLGLFDSYARFLFSFNMFYYAYFYDVTSIIWFMLIPELAWGVLQLWGYLSIKKKEGIEGQLFNSKTHTVEAN